MTAYFGKREMTYFDNVEGIEIIPSTDEMREMVLRAQAGDQEAKDWVITKNIRLLIKEAFAQMRIRNLSGNGAITVDDVIQEGVIGLVRAIELYDPKKANAFSTYAVQWIRQSQSRFVKSNRGLLYLGAGHMERAGKILRIWTEICEAKDLKLGDEPMPTALIASQVIEKEPFVKLIEEEYKMGFFTTALNFSDLIMDSNSLDADEDDRDILSSVSGMQSPTAEKEMLDMVSYEELENIVQSIRKVYGVNHYTAFLKLYGILGYQKQSTVEIAKEMKVSRSSVTSWVRSCRKHVRNKIETLEKETNGLIEV